MPKFHLLPSVKAAPTLLLLAVFALLSVLPLHLVTAQENAIPATSMPGYTESRPPLSVDELIAAAAKGQVRVIVALNTNFQPAGDLSSTQAISQESRINQVRSALAQQVVPLGATIVAGSNSWSIPYLALRANASALQYLRSSSQVKAIYEDKISAATNNQSSLINEGVWDNINNIWGRGFDGTGYTVAIVDTGVESTHSFLSGKVVSEYCSSDTGTYVDYKGDLYTTNSLCPSGAATSTATGAANPHLCDTLGIPEECEHGTHVAGIAAGNDGNGNTVNDGVARGATIIATQVFSKFTDYYGCGYVDCALTFDSDQVNALNRIYTLSQTTNLKIAAVNMSLGGWHYNNQALCDSENALTKAAIDQLRSVNIATIISTGNSRYDNYIGGPGCISSAVAVGSISDSELKISYFSNTHPMMDLLASGEQINSSIPTNTFANFNGTSMATPQVTGAWAVIRQAFPDANVAKILQILQQTGTPIVDNFRSTDPNPWVFGYPNACFQYDPNRDIYFYPTCNNATYKLINVGAAIDLLKPAIPTLNLPTSGAFVGTSVTLSWAAAAHAASYELQIGTTNPPTAATPIPVTGTSKLVTGLEPGGVYYWRVRSVNLGYKSNYSAAVNVLNIDSAGQRNFFTTTTPTLTWTGVTGAVRYEIQISSSPTFTPPPTPRYSTTLSITPTLTEGIWYWRVRACASTTSCTGAFSATESFKIDT